MKQYPIQDLRSIQGLPMFMTGWSPIWGHCIDLKKITSKNKEKREDGNKQFNTENVLKIRIITTHHNQYHKPNKLPYKNSYLQKSLHLYSLWQRIHLQFISRNNLNIHIKRNTENNLYNCAMWQRDYLQEPHKETNEKSCLREFMSVCSPWQ